MPTDPTTLTIGTLVLVSTWLLHSTVLISLAWLLTFAFAHCATICPVLVHSVREGAREAADDGRRDRPCRAFRA